MFVKHFNLNIKRDQLPKFSLTIGMWIEKMPPFLLQLTIVEKSSLIAQFHCFIILINFQYANNTITRQCV
jgi:hypothetical protein